MKLSVIYNRNKDEEYLIEQCKERNQKAQKLLYEKYYNQMFTLCLRYVKDEEDATEVVHEGFVKVFNKIKTFQSESKLSTWMRSIFMHTAVDFFRSTREYKKRFFTTENVDIFQNISDIKSLEEEPIKNQLSQEYLFNLVKTLPPASRMVFNLYVIEEMHHKEIAKQLKISVGTSKWHLSNARKLLAEKIEKKLDNNKQEENGIQ